MVCKEACLHYCINLPHFIIAADFDRVHLLMHMYPNGTDGCRIYAGVCCDTAEEHDVSPGPIPGPSKYMNKRVLKQDKKSFFFFVETLINNYVNC